MDSFTSDWRFHLGDLARRNFEDGFGYEKHPSFPVSEWMKSGTMGVALPSCDDTSWQRVDLPHDWRIALPFSRDAHVDFGGLPGGIGWYRKTFELGQLAPGRRVFVEFDGVFRDSTLWCNGHFLGRHLGGYTGFRHEITDLVTPGSNILAVRVDATEPEGWWYEGAGIYRPVRLVMTDALRIDPWETWVRTDRLQPEPRVAAFLGFDLAAEKSTEVLWEIEAKAASGARVATASGTAQAVPGITRIAAELALPGAQLWRPGAPHLHTLHVRARTADGLACAEHSHRFGVRTVAMDPDRGFLLNGAALKLRGVCLHQDFAGVGVAVSANLHRHRVAALQSIGVNAIRSAHHAASPDLLDACDELGVLVLDENRFFNTSEDGLAQLSALVRANRRHPCVLGWCLGNEEMRLQNSPAGVAIARKLRAALRALDDSRPVGMALNDHFGGPLAAVLDFVGCNYFPQNYDAYRAKLPRLPALATEIGATVATRGHYPTTPPEPVSVHRWVAGWKDRGHVHAAGRTAPKGWATLPEDSWPPVAARDFVGGGFVWTGWDYRGEPFPLDAWPAVASNFGLFDLCGFKKDLAFYYEAEWREEPLVHLCTAWDHDTPGEPVSVVIYGNCHEVELHLNGVSLGRRAMAPGKPLVWELGFAPGRLRAEGYRAGASAVAVVHEVRTSGAPARLALELPADAGKSDYSRDDLVPVHVSLLDGDGVLVNRAEADVEFAVQGPALIVGTDNGDPSSHELVGGSTRRRLFHGRALVMLRLTAVGEFTLTARVAELDPVTLPLHCR